MKGLLDERRYLIPFRSTLLPQVFTGTLVIGGGVAGMRAALAAAEGSDVILLCKDALHVSNTAMAQGGIAAVLDDDDTPESHIQDTLDAGAGLCDEATVDLVVREGTRCVRELIEAGMRFDTDAEGHLRRGREGGHSNSRIYHAGGDSTGWAIQRTLMNLVASHPRIRVFEHCFSLDLITPTDRPGTPVLGAITHHTRFGLQMIWASATILATGGAGMVYRETTNPHVATADGLAMAYRAGADLADMAFMQFHPTTLYLPGAARELISEAVRGEGAHLVDATGYRFMAEGHARAELEPRDVVTRAIVAQLAKQGGRHVWLDCRHMTGFAERFPGITETLRRFELDPSSDLIPVHPAAHYTVGGVRTDLTGRTSLPGLFAVGEVACTGLHGANRLASNSLLEGLVFGEIAGRHALKTQTNPDEVPAPAQIVSDIRPSDHGELDLTDVRSSLRSCMWRNVGIERTSAKLNDATDMLDFWARYTLDKIFDDPFAWETQNLLLVGALIAHSARWREESRGCHWLVEVPESRDAFALHDVRRRGTPDALTEPLRTVHGTVGVEP